MYQKVKIQIVATNVSQRAAETFTEETKDMYIGKVTHSSIRDVDPYWRLLDGTRVNASIDKASNYIDLHLGVYNVLPSKDHSKDVNINNYFFLFRDVEVQLEYTILFPFPALTNYWKQDESERFVGYAKSTITEPSEFIRNMLFAEDILREADVLDVDNIANTISESWDTLKNWFPDIG